MDQPVAPAPAAPPLAAPVPAVPAVAALDAPGPADAVVGTPAAPARPPLAPSPPAQPVRGRAAAAPLPPGVVGSLSPSRAADFVNCPLRYRFRVVDRLPEPPSPAAVRGTVVHSVLERLFDLPAAGRSLPAATELVAPAWADLLAREPELASMFTGPDGRPDDVASADWLASARDLLAGYFALEDPTRLGPAARELYVEHVLPSGLRLRGYVDRLDEANTPGGLALRVVDYKTGRSPGPTFEASAMFQMRFYALVLWRTRDVVPRELRLYYLGDRASLVFRPDEADLRATERRVNALWAAIERAHRTGNWQPSPGRLCGWCDHQAICPAFGGTPPPLPEANVPPLTDDAAPRVCEADG